MMAKNSIAKPSRLIIYRVDVIRITGCSASTASRKIKECKDATGKQDHELLTIQQFCDYYGLDYEAAVKYLNLI